MWDLLQSFVGWLGASRYAVWVGESSHRLAGLFIIHLFGLVLLLGGIVVLSLRLLGRELREVPAQALARTVLPITSAGLCLMLASGVSIFMSGAVSYFDGYWFRLKMILLMIAIIFHFAVFRPVARADAGRYSQTVRSAVSVFGLLIWFGVGWAGRAIAFFSA